MQLLIGKESITDRHCVLLHVSHMKYVHGINNGEVYGSPLAQKMKKDEKLRLIQIKVPKLSHNHN